MTVNDAIRAIRRASGKSQQLFSTELGISLRTFARYEHKQIPEPRQLGILLKYARQNKHSRAVDVFKKALQKAIYDE
jgi:transcriptional regulator with XRE-family HTH domain